MPRPTEPRAPLSQDSYETGDPTQLQYQPVDQAFLDADPQASRFARLGDMGGLVRYLNAMGKRLPNGNSENQHFNVRTGKIERTTAPWYKDPALLGAIALPAAALALPAIAGAGAAGGGGAAAGGGAGAGAVGGGAGAAGAAGGAGAGGAAGLGAIEGGAFGLPASTVAALPGAAGVAGAGGAGGGGFWSGLSQMASGGGKMGTILDTAGKIGGIGSALSSGRAAGRMDEATMQQRQDQLALQRYRDQLSATDSQNRYNINAADTDLERRKFALTAPGHRASNSVRGDVLANAQDTHITGLPKGVNVPTITGGLRPSMFSANTRALGGELSSQALAGQRAGDQFDPLSYVAPPAAPGLTPLPQAGKLDSILNTVGTIGSLASSMPNFDQLLAKYRKPTASGMNAGGDWQTEGLG